MRMICLIIFFVFMATSSDATEFKLLDFHRYGPAPGMELSLYRENAYNLSEIFKMLEFTNDKFNIRLIGTSSKKTNSELMKYYRESMPKELNNAISSAINTVLSSFAYSGDREQLSERWRTVVRVMANSRSEATLFLKTSQIILTKSI